MSPSTSAADAAGPRLVVAYDVADDARRERLARVLADFGVRVQYSVFECPLDQSREAELHALAHKIIDGAEDAVSFFSLCRRCSQQVVRLGREPPAANPQFRIW